MVGPHHSLSPGRPHRCCDAQSTHHRWGQRPRAQDPKARRVPRQPGENGLAKSSPNNVKHWTPGQVATWTLRLVPPTPIVFTLLSEVKRAQPCGHKTHSRGTLLCVRLVEVLALGVAGRTRKGSEDSSIPCPPATRGGGTLRKAAGPTPQAYSALCIKVCW